MRHDDEGHHLLQCEAMSATAHRPFRFGIQASGKGSRADWLDLARAAEDLGYSTLTMPDHFDDQLAPVPAMMAAAAVTEALRVCALVFDNDYKHPVVLAKELATMDVLSDGRMEIGIGAGWMRTDYDKLGIPYDPAGVRIDRFLEGLEIIRRCLRGETFSFEGTHYTITEYTGTPKPVQPAPPVLIGAGAPRMLGIAAREADIVGINPSMHTGVVNAEVFGQMTAASVAEKVARVRDVAGGRMAQIELNIRAFLTNVTDDGPAARERLAGALGVPVEMLETSPFALIGSPDELVEQLQQRREEYGFSYVIVGQDDVQKFAPVVAALAGT